MSSFAGIGEGSIGGFGIGDALTAPIIGAVTGDGDGNVDVSWSYTDSSTDGGVDVERSTDGFSTLTTVASGLSTSTTSFTDTSASRGVTYTYRIERNTQFTTETSGSSDTIRLPKELTRTATMTENGALALAARDPITKARTALLSAGGASATATRDPITKARSALLTASGADVQSSRVFLDVLDDGLGFYEVEYIPEKTAHVTEWIYEEPVGDATDFAIRLKSPVDTRRIDVAVERDDTGDGTVDARSEYITTAADDVPTHVPDIANGGAYYRVLLYGPHVYPDDHLSGLDVGFIH